MVNRIPEQIPENWWDNGAGFFGRKYMLGDNSVEGYIPERPELLEERTLREIDGVEQILELELYSSIVDVPCGYGRHSIELSNRWHNVVGVDINEEHLQAARDKVEQLPTRQHPKYPGFAPRKGTVQFVNQDMRTLCNGLYKPANALINMFYSFGFFATDAENVQTMQQFHLALENGGKFLMHSDVSPEMFEAKRYRTSEMRTLRDGGKLFIEEEFDQKSKRMRGAWTIKRDSGDEVLLTPYSVRLYNTSELRTMARHVGFRKVSFFGSFAGEPFTADSSELIMVAEK